ncbi:MAG: hypothetical protein ATN35_13020 [Epulopiscium sp. Nele67-Bin004]|nr:MAG: hypothetical protein ATN35_13020 [Epulopiscium sp. Nele67-Bin004]
MRQISSSQNAIIKEEIAYIFTDEIIANEQITSIVALIEQFPVPEKDILSAYYLDEQKLAEIATALQLPLSTVKSKLYRSRDKLQKSIIDGGFYNGH